MDKQLLASLIITFLIINSNVSALSRCNSINEAYEEFEIDGETHSMITPCPYGCLRGACINQISLLIVWIIGYLLCFALWKIGYKNISSLFATGNSIGILLITGNILAIIPTSIGGFLLIEQIRKRAKIN